MSLFERVKNRRLNIHEVKKSFPSGSFDPANQEGKFVKNEAGKNLKNIKDEISQRKLEQLKKQQLLNKNLAFDDLSDGGNTTYTPPKKNNVFKKALPGQTPSDLEISGQNKILTQQTPGTNVSVNPSGTNLTNKSAKVTTNVTNTTNTSPATSSSFSGNKVKTNKPSVTTNVSSPKRFKNFLDRVLVSTGVKTDPKYKSKFTTPSSNVTVSGAQSGNNKVLKDVSKKALRSKIFRGLGRFAGGAFAAKDAYDAARDEKLLGRSRTSQVLAGLSKGLGGYLGGALGATLGTLGGGGIGSFALGTGGAITGYNLGSKLGDYIYNQGRKLATGETKIRLPGKKTFKNFKDDVTNKVKGLDLKNLGRNKRDQK